MIQYSESSLFYIEEHYSRPRFMQIVEPLPISTSGGLCLSQVLFSPTIVLWTCCNVLLQLFLFSSSFCCPCPNFFEDMLMPSNSRGANISHEIAKALKFPRLTCFLLDCALNIGLCLFTSDAVSQLY